MKFWNRLTGFSLAIVVISAAGFASAQEPTAGVVRISDQPAVGEQMKLQSYSSYSNLGGGDCNCRPTNIDGNVVYCDDDHCPYCNGNCHGGCWRSRTWELICHPFCADDCYEGPRFNPGCHHGYCGYRGVAPFGCYTMAYPVNPDYCDGRDGGLYAAQGYGINMTVPLAPNVGAAYNYGWGVPSSRLTYMSNVLPMSPMPLSSSAPIVIRNR